MTKARPYISARLICLIGLLSSGLSGYTSAERTVAEKPVIETLTRAEFEAAAGFSEQCCGDSVAPSWASPEPIDINARSSLDTLFSAQSGSWLFESLVRNGLLRIASQYQPTHPRALTLHKGNSSLAGLARKLSDPSILEQKGLDDAGRTIYHLHYPLIIGRDATLTIDKAALMLDANAASVIVNTGQLIITDAVVSTLQDDLEGGARFRPFIVGWNGSRIQLKRATLSRLGYNAYLSGGLTLGYHASLSSRGRADVLISDSLLDHMETGLISEQANVRISTTSIRDSVRFGVDFSAGDLQIIESRVERTLFNTGIRIRHADNIRMHNNIIKASHRDAVLIEGETRSLFFSDNILEESGGDGIGLQGVTAVKGPLLIQRNIIRNNTRSGINSLGSGPLLIRNNTISGNEHYALRAAFAENAASQSVWLQNNIFANSGEASIITSGDARLGLSANQFKSRYVIQPVIRGQLATAQTQILKVSKTPDQALYIRQVSDPSRPIK